MPIHPSAVIWGLLIGLIAGVITVLLIKRANGARKPSELVLDLPDLLGMIAFIVFVGVLGAFIGSIGFTAWVSLPVVMILAFIILRVRHSLRRRRTQAMNPPDQSA